LTSAGSDLAARGVARPVFQRHDHVGGKVAVTRIVGIGGTRDLEAFFLGALGRRQRRDGQQDQQ
jgi:hypothetical protein